MQNTQDHALVLSCDPRIKRTIASMPLMVLAAEAILIWQCINLKAAGGQWMVIAGAAVFYFVTATAANTFVIYRSLRTLTVDHSGVTLKTIKGSTHLRWGEIRDFGGVNAGKDREGRTLYGIFFSRTPLERRDGEAKGAKQADIYFSHTALNGAQEIRNAVEFAEKLTLVKPVKPWNL